VGFVEDMRVSTSVCRFRTSPRRFAVYTKYVANAYQLHGMDGAARAENFQKRLVQLWMWLPTRAFDPETRKFSVRRLFASEQDRIVRDTD
jgi:hypothetical protein